MNDDKFMDKGHSLANHFESVFQRLLSGEELDLYAEDVSLAFEVVAANLLYEVPDRKSHYYDGAVGLTAHVRKTRQVEFNGAMWVGDDSSRQWTEDFRARVTDKQVTKQGIWITLWIGSDRAEGDLATAFGVTQ